MSKTALILFAHGSRDPDWASSLQRVCALVGTQAPNLRVELSFLEFIAPTLHDSVAVLVSEGFDRLVVLPMFIAPGGHLKRDLPLRLDELRTLYPRVRFEQAAALGEADRIVQAMADHVLALAGE